MPKAAPARLVSHTVAEEVRAFCIANASEKNAMRWARFFTEGYDAYGVDYKNPAWEQNRLRWLARLKEAGPSAFLDAGDLLVPGKYEETSLAILFAAGSRDAYTPQAFERIGNWFEKGIRNWGHTDVLSGEVLSAFLLDGVVPLEALERWRDSANKFQRRAVPVTLVKLVGGPPSASRLLRVIEPLMQDSERVVQQGVGWFLRELWKRRPGDVEKFLLRFKNTCPRLIVQYATEKMDKAHRERFRRSK
jgi:3-methyladenine DNA glycosylase AlkD